MEKIVVKQNNNESISINSRVILDNRNKFSVTGVTRVVSTNEQNIVAEIGKTKMYITGSNLHISKLDVESGIIEGDGLVDSIRYNKNSQNVLKKMFK